jgi:hypothetical protein
MATDEKDASGSQDQLSINYMPGMEVACHRHFLPELAEQLYVVNSIIFIYGFKKISSKTEGRDAFRCSGTTFVSTLHCL